MPETALGRLLKDLRGERGLTLREVEQLGEVDHAYVHRLETGAKNAPSDEVLEKLSRALRPGKRDADMMKFLATHPAVDPDLVDAVRNDPTVTFEEFQAATSMVSRGTRPDYPTLLARIRKFMME
jgi:HTH-type transcriptional regulator, competence development regulator